MFVEEVASLYLVEGNDNVFEKDDMFFSEGHCKSANDTGEDVQQLGGAVELEGLMDEGVEAVVDGLSDHFSPGDQFGVEPVEDVFEVLAFAGLL